MRSEKSTPSTAGEGDGIIFVMSSVLVAVLVFFCLPLVDRRIDESYWRLLVRELLWIAIYFLNILVAISLVNLAQSAIMTVSQRRTQRNSKIATAPPEKANRKCATNTPSGDSADTTGGAR